MEERNPTPRRRRGRAVVAALAIVTALLVPGSAQGAVTGLIPNWPELLPPMPGTPSGTVPLDFEVCPSGASSCPQAVVDEMYERWRPLDASCEHRAVFALTYLRTTEEFQRTVEADPYFFSDVPWINHEDAIFAELYFRAYDNWMSGNRDAVPGAWKVAFEASESPNLLATGDLLLGLNAHISRDLPYTLAHVGLVKPDGTSRKPDHDRVNAFLERVADPLQIELADRYDEIFTLTDLEPSPVDEEVILQLVKLMRENAWRNAEMLVSAPNAEARQGVSALIELEAELFARTIQLANTVPGWGTSRDAHCAAQPPESVSPSSVTTGGSPLSGAAGASAASPASKPKRRCRRARKGRRAATTRARCRKPRRY